MVPRDLKFYFWEICRRSLSNCEPNLVPCLDLLCACEFKNHKKSSFVTNFDSISNGHTRHRCPMIWILYLRYLDEVVGQLGTHLVLLLCLIWEHVRVIPSKLWNIHIAVSDNQCWSQIINGTSNDYSIDTVRRFYCIFITGNIPMIDAHIYIAWIESHNYCWPFYVLYTGSSKNIDTNEWATFHICQLPHCTPPP